ncbi:hypothetical protein ACQP2E_15775 [Actinoplanes sp. CA-015351]|uniref:hypothetical protein n=1 Tax=Actinoplanes sp. CA-015351 TaxID=3239897 RepID=UPI003D98F8EB
MNAPSWDELTSQLAARIRLLEIDDTGIGDPPTAALCHPPAAAPRLDDMNNHQQQPAGFLDSAEQIVTTNLLGSIRLIAAFIDHLRSKPDATIPTVSGWRSWR